MAGILILFIVVTFIVALCVAGHLGRRRAAKPARFALTVLVVWVFAAGAGLFLLILAFGLLLSR